MPDFIKFGGQNLAASGLTIEKAPGLSRPARKINIIEVPGRSGELIEMQDAWENYEQPYEIITNTAGTSNAPASIKQLCNGLFLNGYQDLEDSFEPDIIRRAYFAGPIDVENILNIYGRATIIFRCKPQRYLKSGQTAQAVASGAVINNPEQYIAKPLVKITGSGDGTLTIGGKVLTITGMTDYLYIDAETQDVYRQTAENKNSLASGSFPELAPGNNTITYTNGITGAEITPRFFYI